MMGGTDDYPTDENDAEAATASALRYLRAPVRGMPLPWEIGMMGAVFGRGQPWTGPLRDALLPRRVPMAAIGGAPRIQDEGVSESVGTRPLAIEDISDDPDDIAQKIATKKRRMMDVTIQDFDDRKLDEALRTWRGLVGEMGESSGLFNQIMSCENGKVADRSFNFAFFGKPASTLAERACSLRLYVRWAHASGFKAFPLSEDVVFKYLDDLLMEGAPPTRAQSFTEALNFAKGYVGLQGVHDALSSRRVHGAVLASYARKDVRKQRSPLTKAEVVSLELFMTDDTSPDKERDGILAGFVLFCLYTRTRVGDACRIGVELTVDLRPDGSGYINSGMLEHKTSSRVRAKISLPVGGAAVGVGGSSWASHWLALRARAGLNAATDGCLMPAPGYDGSWSRKRITTHDTTVWLREILRVISGMEPARASSIGSHSLKATLLSWAAKFGIAPAARRKLGGHVKPKDVTLTTYSRDELAGPLRDLDQVLAAVRSGEFDPDSTRSGRFTRDAAVAATSSSSSDSSSSSPVRVDTDDASSGEDSLIAAVSEDLSGIVTPVKLPDLPSAGLSRNLANGVLHGVRNADTLLCGRTLPKRNLMLTAWPKRSFPLCRDCFR